MNKAPQGSVFLTNKRKGLLAFVLLVVVILAYKAYDDGWLLPRTPVALNDQPALLFFNRHKGCECALVVYQAAARQLHEWPKAQQYGIQVIQIDLDRRPDLGEQYHVVRAPALLLLNSAGDAVYLQNEVVTDLEPLNLPLLEQKILDLLAEHEP